VALLEFLKWNDEQIKSVGSAAAHVAATVDHERRAFAGMADNILEDLKKVFMTPVSSLLETLPKLVRDLSHDLTKEVDLVIEGGEIEISRRILEQLKDPLIHIIRNSIDHGIESVEGRTKARKPARAILRVTVSQVDSNNVAISISDDGSGIDVRRVIEAAINHGLLSADGAARMNREEALSLIFESDLSTSPIISDLSGRGLGLAIVREKVEKLGGSVAVETDEGRGTTFRLLLPVTLASFRGILVRAAGRLFIAPTSNVERAIRIKASDIKSVENRETIVLSGRSVSLVRLADLLSLPQTQAPAEESVFIQLLVLGAGDRRIALGVDEVLNEQEVLVKGLGAHLKRVPNISAATVLGSGKLAPILNVDDLLKSAARMGSPLRAVAQAGEGERRKKSILIAEDSITSRMLLRNILESAGYDVKTAMDGVDAFTTLTNETFDLLVSDIEMPRMNGLDLTSKIRGDKNLAGLPVVLVTSLGSREDREHGIDVGANAYIVKSSFDQSNLLEVVRRLV
jgi:two-component system chemotaxis sensor kinase CheA